MVFPHLALHILAIALTSVEIRTDHACARDRWLSLPRVSYCESDKQISGHPPDVRPGRRRRRVLITLVIAIGLIVVTLISLNLYYSSYSPSATTGILTLRASPPEAVVSLDGKPVGSAANFRQEIAAGDHQVEISADGYQTLRQTVTLAAGAEKSIKFALEPVPLPPPPAGG